MSAFQPAAEDYEARVRESFLRQGIMRHIGASVAEVRPGFCEIRLPYSDDLSQQHGFFHGGAIATIVDSAGGFAAFSLYGDDDGVLTVEFKLNLMAPAVGDLLIARGEVVRPGRTLTVTRGEVSVIKGGRETPCALMQQTMMRIVGRGDVVG